MTRTQEETLSRVVNGFIEDLRMKNAQPISVPFVANSILESLPHTSILNDVEATAVYMGIAQVARAALRGQHDREYNAERIGQQEIDLPESSLLNGGYSVMREKEPVYVPRLQMTRADMEYVCAKFDALAGHFARASRALRAEWHRVNEPQVVPA